MALINCPECNREVSSRARACPHCGCPFVEVVSPGTKATGTPKRPTVTERTGKPLKAQMLASGCIFFVGVIMAVVVSESPTASPEVRAGAAIGLIGGGLWFLVTRFRVWWHHD